MRAVECLGMLDLCEAIPHASLSRETSSDYLNIQRLDFSLVDPPEWRDLRPVRPGPEGPEVRGLPFDYHLRRPYSRSLRENYEAHCRLREKG
jgi:hypothetical protein